MSVNLPSRIDVSTEGFKVKRIGVSDGSFSSVVVPVIKPDGFT